VVVHDRVDAAAEHDAVAHHQRGERQPVGCGLGGGQFDGTGQSGVLVEADTEQRTEINRGHAVRLAVSELGSGPAAAGLSHQTAAS
jgi:hypothetical protein